MHKHSHKIVQMPKKPISVKFEIPYFTVSGIQVVSPFSHTPHLPPYPPSFRPMPTPAPPPHTHAKGPQMCQAVGQSCRM
jgi:hypothetical protein